MSLADQIKSILSSIESQPVIKIQKRIGFHYGALILDPYNAKAKEFMAGLQQQLGALEGVVVKGDRISIELNDAKAPALIESIAEAIAIDLTAKGVSIKLEEQIMR